MFIAWEDGRSGTASDIYIHRVNSSGPTTDVTGPVAQRFELLGIKPNPCRSRTSFRFALPESAPVDAAKARTCFLDKGKSAPPWRTPRPGISLDISQSSFKE